MHSTTPAARLNQSASGRFTTAPDWTPRLLAMGAAAPVLAAVVVMVGHNQWSLPHAKLFLLAAQYLFMLPLLALAIRLDRPGQAQILVGKLSARTQALSAIVLYSILLLPLAFNLGLGRYQGDESAYLFEARCLTTGHLSAPQPPAASHAVLGFAHHLFIDGRWLGKYPPGWPLVLSLMTLLKAEWLLNPLLGLLLLFLTYEIGVEMFGPIEGISATAMLGASAFMLLNCLGFMSHVLCGLLIAVAALCFVRALRRSPETRSGAYWTSAMLIALLAAELVRPFTAMCAGLALIAALHFRPDWPALRRSIAWTGAFAVLTGVVVGFENYLLTGSFFHSAYSAYNNGQLKEFSLRPRDLFVGLVQFTPVRLVDTASVSFPFILPLALYGLWRGYRNRAIWALSLVFLSLVFGYLVQLDDSDSPIGERYYFEGYFALALVAGYGIVQLASDLRLTSRLRQQLGIALVTASLAGVLVGTSWEIRLREPSKRMVDAMRTVPFDEGIVFVKGTKLFPAFNWNFNDPRSRILELIDPGPDKRAAIAEAIGAHHWICLHYDARTGLPVWLSGSK
ncbi:MAG: hypothetical protein ACJ746_18920 [Bryobacteraceae bacterium]